MAPESQGHLLSQAQFPLLINLCMFKLKPCTVFCGPWWLPGHPHGHPCPIHAKTTP